MTIVFLPAPAYKYPAILSPSSSLNWVQKLIGEFLERRKFKAVLSSLSESELRDIGLTEAEVLSLENLSMEASSADNIAKAQKARNGKW